MNAIEIDGIRLTEKMRLNILSLQEKEGIEGYLSELNAAIRLIASASAGTPVDYERKALKAIFELSNIREILFSLTGKEEVV